jgi:hypothetical protein
MRRVPGGGRGLVRPTVAGVEGWEAWGFCQRRAGETGRCGKARASLEGELKGRPLRDAAGRGDSRAASEAPRTGHRCHPTPDHLRWQRARFCPPSGEGEDIIHREPFGVPLAAVGGARAAFRPTQSMYCLFRTSLGKYHLNCRRSLVTIRIPPFALTQSIMSLLLTWAGAGAAIINATKTIPNQLLRMALFLR